MPVPDRSKLANRSIEAVSRINFVELLPLTVCILTRVYFAPITPLPGVPERGEIQIHEPSVHQN